MSASPPPADDRATGTRDVRTPGEPTVDTALRLIGRVTPVILLIVLVGFTAWTLAYQVALLGSLRSGVTLAGALVVAGLGVALLWWRPPGAEVDEVEDTAPLPAGNRLGRGPQVAVAVVGTALALALALTGRYVAAVGLLAVASLGGAALIVWRGRGPTEPSSPATEPAGRLCRLSGVGGHPGLWLTAWLWALGCGVVSAVFSRPDGDDAYFVNLSTWVSERGTFPLRDTMFSNDVLPAQSSHNPPVHSIEGLFGTLSGLTGIPAGSVVYNVMPPLLTACSVLALAYAIAVCRIPMAPAALSAAVIYLLCSGSSGASYGSFFALRIWQGKSVFLSLVIPLLIALAVRYVRSGGWQRWTLLACAVVASIGTSNTSVLLVPILIVGFLPAAWALGGLRRAGGVAWTLIYPLGIGGLALLLAPARTGGAAAGAAAVLNPVSAIPGARGLLVATALAVGLGWLGLRSVAARWSVMGVLAVFAIAVLPPVTTLLDDLTGAKEVLWRLWWVVPTPLLVAGVVGWVATWARATVSRRTVVTAGAALVMGLTPLVGGFWIGSPRSHAVLVSPATWKVPAGGQEKASYLAGISRPGDVVLAPWYVSRTLAAVTVRVHAVAPRTFYLADLKDDPTAQVSARIALQSFADSKTVPATELKPLLATLNVRTVCVAAGRGLAIQALAGAGLRPVGTVHGLACLQR